MDNINTPGAGGFHQDQNGQPYALVQYSSTWSLTVSHETLEMLGDPWGNRMRGGPSPEDGATQVQFLVEVCDPCEDAQYAYSINGVLVSDFITPHFYDPKAAASERYSFTGALPGPRQILRGGYVSYLDPTNNHMYQELWLDGAKPTFRDLGAVNTGGTSLREWVDAQTQNAQLVKGAPADIESVVHAAARAESNRKARAARAEALHRAIEGLL